MPVLTVEHRGRRLDDLPHVARLLPQLPEGCRLRRLAAVDQAGGHLDAHLVYRRAVLLLEDDLGPRGLLDDGQDADPVDVAALGPRPPPRRLPEPGLPARVAVLDP